MQTALISGITGYTGSHLAEALANKGWNVIGLTRKGSTLPSRCQNNPRISLHIYEGSAASLAHVFKNNAIDAVFHLAAMMDLKPSQAAHDAMLDANVRFGIHMLDAMLESDCRTFINTGTFWQQGETSAYQPMNFYAATKQMFSDALNWYAKGHGIKAVTLQMYDIYGPHDPRPKIFPQLMNAATQAESMNMSPGEQKLYPVHITDVVRAYEIAAANAQDGHAIYSIAGEATSLKHMVETWAKTALAKGLPPLKVNWGALPYRDGQIMQPFKGAALPGWRQEMALAPGIESLFKE